MKTKISTLITTLLFTCFAQAAGIPSTAPVVVDAEKSAKEFLTRNSDYFIWHVYLEQTLVDGSYKWLSADLTERSGKVTQMRVSSQEYPDGFEITIPEGGLSGLPRNTIGQTQNFNFWGEGYTTTGEFVSYGSFYDPLFQNNEEITVELRPSARVKTIPFPRSLVPAGVIAENLVLEYGNSSAGWNSYLGGFWIYIDPLVTADWVLRDQTTGRTYPITVPSPTTPSQYSSIGVTYVGGGVKLDWAEKNWINFASQTLNSNVTREEGFTPGKVYFTDLEESGLGLYVWGLLGKVEVSTIDPLDPDGDPVLVRSMEVSASTTYFSLPAGYGPMIITFTGTVTDPYGFNVQFYLQ